MDTMTDEEVERETARQSQVLEAMRADGVPTEEALQDDYFGFEETHRVLLPDGRSWIDHQTLNEGGRKKYLNQQNREVKVQKVTGDAILKMATGDERHSLLMSAIVGWNLMRRNPKTGDMEAVAFNEKNLRDFLEKAPPRIIDLIEKDIRKHNPWLSADVTVEDIDKQIEELQELRAEKVKEAEGKEAS